MSSLEMRQLPAMISLACLAGRLEADPALAEAARGEMRSAINTVARVVRMPLHLVPIAPSQLRILLDGALPAAASVSPSRFRNAKSLLRKAMALYDPKVIPARSRLGLLPEWAVLIEDPAARPLLRGIARFSKYCSAAGIRPADVTQAVYDGFYTDLVEHCLIRSPRETQQTAGRAWNEAARSVPGWPQTLLVIASHRRNPSLPWDTFPKSLLEEVDRYLAPRRRGKFKFSQGVPVLEDSTITSKRSMLRQFATCLVESGRDPATLGSLADLVTMETAEAGLTVCHERAGGIDTGHTYNMGYLLYSIAKHWLKLDAATVLAFKEGCKSIRPLHDGMTLKNRRLLQQFNDPKKLRALLELPARMMREVEACPPDRRTKAEARIAQIAVALEFLIAIPLRIGNVSELELGRTLILDGRKTGYVVINPTEVKNDITIEAPLSAEFLRLADIYLQKFHALLAPPGCRMLFPSADGGHKRVTVLGTQISTCLAKRCGIQMNPHLFRHLAAWLYLDACPGAYGIVHLLLAHKRFDTTKKAYCGMEIATAFRLHDANIIRLRAGGVMRGPGICTDKAGR